ncbi:hypothetical protein [Geodermatophilus sp. SYSU D01105]
MHRRFAWGSPSARLVLSAALDALVDVGCARLTVPSRRPSAELVDHPVTGLEPSSA